eukprot:7189258-Prymnesium_polylepis.1
MTGSFNSVKVNVVAAAPSKVTRGMDAAVAGRPTAKGWMSDSMCCVRACWCVEWRRRGRHVRSLESAHFPKVASRFCRREGGSGLWNATSKRNVGMPPG